ncbi:MAB_1171c family putative transporter [Kitasatospora sp. NBC_01302]|uniref:MAB_1171c family putative transporter n=1 Tax=Kitasatospora sp. NBC_01302 TaxID=2903575 RepID=UPI002E13DA09|nr:hypothetical protein OG294_01345 [Kitasatospora sp. NBC_01302]
MLLLTVVYGVLSVITWAAFVYKVRDLIGNWRNRELQLLCLAIATFAAPFVLASPHVYILIDRVIGTPNIASLIIYICVAICLTSFVALLVSWSSAQARLRARHWVGLGYALATLAVMTIFFFLGDTGSVEHPIDFDVTFEAVRYVDVFLLSYQLLFTLAMGMLVVLCRRYAAMVDRPWTRRGLRIVTAGAWFGLGYCVPKVVNMVWDLFGFSPLHVVSSIVAPLSASVSAALFSLGFTMPAWGAGVSQLRDLTAVYRSYQRLYPLWRDLAVAFPELVLMFAPTERTNRWSLRTAHRIFGRQVIELCDGSIALRPHHGPEDGLDSVPTLRDLELLVTRQQVEIRDIQLRLRPHYTEAVAAAAREQAQLHRLAAKDVEAVVEATQLAVALHAHNAGIPLPALAVQGIDDPAGGDRAEELAWLVKVAAAYGSSPVVADVRTRFAGSDTGVSA